MTYRCPPIPANEIAPEIQADHDWTHTRLEPIFADKYVPSICFKLDPHWENYA